VSRVTTQDLVGDFQVSRLNHFTANAQAVQIAAADPTRWALIISGDALNTMGIGTDSSMSGSQGIVLTTTTPVWSGTFRDFGAMINLAWFVRGTGPVGVNVFEILYRPAMRADNPEKVLREYAAKTAGMRG